jgi:integrase/recombinase XerD
VRASPDERWITQPAEFRKVTRAHVLAWRKDLEGRSLSGTTIRRKLAALSSLFEHLCDANAVTHNPVKGARRRPWATARPGRYSMRREPRRSRVDAIAILSVLLYHGLRRGCLLATPG